MSIYDSKIWIKDLDVVLNYLPELSELEEKVIFITGATGLICSAVVDLLIRYNETHDKKIKIIVAGRTFEKVSRRFDRFSAYDYFSFCQFDATTRNKISGPCDYIIHGASNASPNKIIREPVETMLSNFLGLKSLLDYSKEQRVKRVLYISSSEVYGRKESDLPFKEHEYGFVDILNSRNSYAIGKRAAETLCISYADEFDVESVIVRPGHIYGPTASTTDSRVSSAWAYDAANGRDIIMKSNGAQIRSYVYCLDCASAILNVLLKGDNKHAYNISNPDSIISIRDIAEIMATSGGVEIINDAPSASEMKGFNPMSNSSLDSTELLKLGWKGLFNPSLGFGHTIEILRMIAGIKEK